MVDQGHLAGAVSLIHASDLGGCDVALIDDADHILGEIVDERVRGLSRGSCLITSQNDTAPKLIAILRPSESCLITSQNDTAPKHRCGHCKRSPV